MKALVAAAAIAVAPTLATAASDIDFSAYATGTFLGNTLTTPQAVLVSADDFVLFDVPTGSFCAADSPVFNTCAIDFSVTFTSPVTGLSFEAFGVNPGDAVDAALYDPSDSILGIIQIRSDDVYNLLSYGAIGRIEFDDLNSTGAGVGFQNFSFDQQVADVPVPAAAPLLLGALGLLALRRRG